MIAALLSVMLIASEGTGTTVTPPAPVANEVTDADKKICKRQPVTGQIQGTKRVCMTADQWKRVQEATQRRR